MSNFIKDYLATLSDEDKKAIVKNWKTFTEKGVIGDEPIRRHAEVLMQKVNGAGSIVHWMQSLTFEILLQHYQTFERI